jgi:hypothetical protein
MGDARIFRQVQPSWGIIALHLVFLYYSWQLCCSCLVVGGVSTSPFISKGVRLQGR